MVSTRGIRYKFSEGERVLCYEPDPTKAKVLYDSKVLEVTESKDKRGRRTVEYLIHFQGWNSSWDRCVSEDFVLKDTEENRQLQRDLAEKSQLQLGAYLYRRERKKGGSASSGLAGPGPAKRTRHGFSDDGSSTSTQPDECETGDTDSSSASGSSSQPRSPPANMQGGRAQIILPSALRDRLTFDYHLVVKRGRLSLLPASPCAAEILESFVKWFARAGAWNPSRPRHEAPQRPDMLDVACRLNLVREVADGLRVYFDFILRGHLLYKQELHQYHDICKQFMYEQDEDETITYESDSEEENSQDSMNIIKLEQDMKSPKMPEYSHLPPDPVDEKSNGAEEHNEEDVMVKTESVEIDEQVPIKIEAVDEVEETEDLEKEIVVKSEPDEPISSDAGKTQESHPAMRNGNVARRLRSHKSVVSQSENEEPTPSTSTSEPRVFENMSSSVSSSDSSTSEPWSSPQHAAGAPPSSAPRRTPLSLLLDKVAKWQIIEREGTEHLPCRIYGAIHLARLFVKLPDFLNATPMPDFKLKLILKHIDMFVRYLDEHSEWFGESYYIADAMSRSH